ncbi:MAG: FecR domain-containing protein, partial [Pyrinomonadaceae bacterium]
MSNKNTESILDKVTAEIRNEQIDGSTVNQAAERVWARLSAEEGVELRTETVAVDRIKNCADFQSLIPAYLDGHLTEARSLLLVDHTHECIPCRKAMKEARSRNIAPKRTAIASRRYSLQPVVLRWGIAAALVIGFGLLALPFIQRLPFGGPLEATVEAAEGQVFQIADTKSTALTGGEKLQKNERIRTAKGGRAIIRLEDGSAIEMKDRSELAVTKNVQGTTIHLNRGSIVVEAASQRGGRLFVDTGDSRVSVTGTVFSVNSGTKGSRISVIEGEVHFDHKGNERVLRPGDQATTNPSIELIPVQDEVAWSRKASNYAAALAAFASLRSDLKKVQQPGVRNSTHLLDLMPENTVIYAALPNLTATIAESHRIMQERISQNAALRQWWDQERSGHKGRKMEEVIGTIREFGDYLGDEIAVSVSMDEKG